MRGNAPGAAIFQTPDTAPSRMGLHRSHGAGLRAKTPKGDF
jgi:hypothetical protein